MPAKSEGYDANASGVQKKNATVRFINLAAALAAADAAELAEAEPELEAIGRPMGWSGFWSRRRDQ